MGERKTTGRDVLGQGRYENSGDVRAEEAMQGVCQGFDLICLPDSGHDTTNTQEGVG